MIRTKKLAAILLSLVALPFSVGATPIDIVPGLQDVDLGDQVAVDIVVTPDQGVLIGSYDFFLNFDASILSIANVMFGDSLGDGFFTSDQAALNLGGGTLNLAEVSFLFDLTELQDGSSFSLATILFDTIGIGASNLDFTGNIFGESSPFNILGDDLGFGTFAEAGTGMITVREPVVQVSEPSTPLLLLSGLLALAFCRRKVAHNSVVKYQRA